MCLNFFINFSLKVCLEQNQGWRVVDTGCCPFWNTFPKICSRRMDQGKSRTSLHTSSITRNMCIAEPQEAREGWGRPIKCQGWNGERIGVNCVPWEGEFPH